MNTFVESLVDSKLVVDRSIVDFRDRVDGFS